MGKDPVTAFGGNSVKLRSQPCHELRRTALRKQAVTCFELADAPAAGTANGFLLAALWGYWTHLPHNPVGNPQLQRQASDS